MALSLKFPNIISSDSLLSKSKELSDSWWHSSVFLKTIFLVGVSSMFRNNDKSRVKEGIFDF
jgi:hypothetical protein